MTGVGLVAPPTCLCGEADCLFLAVGYPLCRPCDEHHRPPECAINPEGRALMWCGHPWSDEPCPCADED